MVFVVTGFAQKGKDKKGENGNESVPKKQEHKVTVCHNGKVIEISESALQAHLNHGDAAGPCFEIDYTGNVTSYLEQVGKTQEPIGTELKILEKSFTANGSAASDEIFVISEGKLVLIEIVAQRGKKPDVLSFLSSAYGITEFLTSGTDDLTATVLFPIDQLSALNSNALIRYVRPVYKPINNSGAITSLGDVAQQSDNARKAFGVNGAGITVGVLSDSYDAKGLAGKDYQNGDLPGPGNPDGNLTPVNVLKEYPQETIGSRFSTVDEGRAMLQIVHDVAPKASLAFRTGVLSPGDMAQGILDLASAGCNVIVDDITHYKEPFYQDGIIARAVNQVTSAGVQYFTSAGNFGKNSYESQFNPTNNSTNHDFNLGAGVDVLQNVRMGVGFFRIVLQWNDDYYSLPGATNDGARNDLDIFLISNAGDTIVNHNTDNLGKDPIEIMTFNVDDGFASVNIAINRVAGSGNVNFKYIVFEGNKDFGFNEYAVGSSTIMGHANAAGAMTVGAVLYSNTPAFNVSPSIASFSSWGGLPVNGINRNKPDFVAPNGANTTVNLNGVNIDSDLFPNFFGTSASAPHAAGVAALLLEAKTKFGVAFNLRQLLQQTAINMGAPGYDNASGYGLIQADAAMLTFAAPIPAVTGFVIPPGATPRTAPFNLTINGKNLYSNSRVLLNGIQLPTTFVNSSQLVAAVPVFAGDPPIQVKTFPITTGGKDGGTSQSLYLFKAAKKVVEVSADNKSKKFGERLPPLTASIKVDGVPIDSTISLSSLGLDSLYLQSTANSLSGVGLYVIKPVNESTDSTWLEQFDYKFINGTLDIEKLPLSIVPEDMTRTFGERISGITFGYDYDKSNIDSLDDQSILNLIQDSHLSTFIDVDSIALINRARGIVNDEDLINRARGIVNGTGWIVTPATLNRARGIVNEGDDLINRARGIVNQIYLDVPNEVLDFYEIDPTDAFTNRARGIVNGGSMATGQATINRARGIVNDQGDIINRARGIVNDGALVNGDGGVAGFEDLVVVVDSLDYAVSDLFSMNVISGLNATPETYQQFIVPGGYFALEAENFEITYGLGNLTITPAALDVAVQDYTIIDGSPLPEFTSAITGFAYGQDETDVFESISYSPESYEGQGTYPIVPTFVFTDQSNYVLNDIVPGMLKVVSANGLIAFSHFNNGYDLEVGSVKPDGSNPAQLDLGLQGIRDPQLSPSGNHVVFTLAPARSIAATSTPQWLSAGPGTVTLTDGDFTDNNKAQFTYFIDPAGFSGQSWTFAAVASTDDPFELVYDWSGFHAFFAVTTTLQITDQAGTRVVDNIQPGGVGGPDNCCGGVSAGFRHQGTVMVDPVAGQPITFTLSGNNGDSNNVLTGTFTIAPANTALVSDLEPPQNESLWKARVDGSDLTQLSGGGSHSPSFSENGGKIAFVQNNQIGIMNADGTDVSILTSSSTSKRWTSISPDGQEVVYVQSFGDIYTDSINSVWKVNINTFNTTQISPISSLLSYRSPVFLKDGSKIIVVGEDKLGAAPNAIMSMNPDGSSQVALFIDNNIANDVSVSPDNKKLAFLLKDSEGNGYALQTMDTDGTNVVEIYSEDNLIWTPSWGFDSEYLELVYVNIPDPNFEQALIDLGIDSDGVVNQLMLRTEAEAVSILNIADPVNNPSLPNVTGKINDLTGIEAFVNLIVLEAQYNSLDSLNLSKNTLLVSLRVWDNQLTSLDLSQNAALSDLNCDLNQLTELDLANNTALTYLSCSENNLVRLNVSQSTGLLELFCVNNQLPTLDLTNNTSLLALNCDSNQLTRLDVSQNISLTSLFAQYNQITALDLQQNTNLVALYVESNQIATLDLSQNAALAYLSLHTNQLQILDVTQNTALVSLQCGDNQLTSLDVSQNALLTGLFCDFNQLAALDVSQNTSLTALSCFDNFISSLDVSQNTALELINAGANQLSALDVSQNTALKILVCSNDLLTSLDLSQNGALTELLLDNNQLTSLDLRNGNNANIVVFNATGNNLSCVNVDDQTGAYLGSWTVDPFVSFSNNCGNATLTQGNITITPNPVIDYLEVVHADGGVPVGNISIEVYNNSGGLESVNVSPSLIYHGVEVDMTLLVPGIYFLQVFDGIELQVFRIQKN